MTLKCPICASEHSVELFKINLEQVLNHVSSDTEKRDKLKDIVKDLWKAESSSYHKCTLCKFTFAHPFIAGNTLFYSTLYDKPSAYPSEKWEYDKTIDAIKKDGSYNNKRLLEIGAGNGAFLRLISPEFIKKGNVVATEYSDNGSNNIREGGFECYNVSVNGLNNQIGDTKFDIICLFQVVEHMDDIMNTLKQIDLLLNSRGHLFIAVPNPFLREMLEKNGIYLDIPPIHIGRFPLETFQLISGKFGWNIEDHGIEHSSFRSKAQKFLFDRYSTNNRYIKIESMTGIKRKIYRYLSLLQIFIKYIRVFTKLADKKNGTSFWIHFKKNDLEKLK